VIWIGLLKMFVKQVPPNAGRSEGAFAAGAKPSQPLVASR
jgi:hypothetical protein